MTQNIYDDDTFFEGYSRLDRSLEGLVRAPEWPALQAMLPPVTGSSIVDLGCGYGWFCRWARDAGASSVLGIDVSERMLERAQTFDKDRIDPAIRYERADLETLALPHASFDLAYSSLAFHYVENLVTLLRTIHRALVPDGMLVFSVEHPVYMASRHPGWIVDAHGHKTWPLDSYQFEGPRVTNWFTDGVIKQHRTLGTLLNTLIETGFAIAHVDEWGPTDAQIAALPALAEERERPMMLLVAARRESNTPSSHRSTCSRR
ncbi:class I SAM-dependent methyltransferase [Paraburkholderia flava]|uniref:class I SAM-dependent methyltransferase n=1 Tax=Paraburkholderia flava TaxID=2547393 RepID=UPI00105D6484|nr:class I SAM-dependent methyltransferase [Paraburkholderia flava]